MKKQFFIGADVAKLTFDATVLIVIDHVKQPSDTMRFDNNASGLKAFEKWLKSLGVTFHVNSILVIENTGIYHRSLWQFCSKKNLPIHIGNAAHIKWSFGIARGKNDKIDSIRLANYAYKEKDELQHTPILNPVIIHLKDMWTARSKIQSQLNSMRTYLTELKGVSDKATHAILEKAHKEAIDGMSRSLKLIETEIKNIIKENEELKKNYDLLITVPGIGRWIATYLIGCTCNFAAKISGKQLACYAGVVPFENTSGTSIKRKPKVHKMANKELKKLLYMGAMSAVQYNVEFKKYYERKLQEGKPFLSVVNAVKNKIILRAAAVVNNQRAYVDNVKLVA